MVPVSAEILDRLEAYLAVLAKWNARINLVGPATLRDPWRRHILDSAQMVAHLPPGRLADLGTGAGLPGLILAILGREDVHLVESDQRKVAFLREAARITGANPTLYATRIEAMPALSAAVVTARALAPLDRLLDMAERFLGPETACYFLKGARVEDELTEARKSWQMEVELLPSLADEAGVIVKVTGIGRRGT
jgi:16S rRNA (guanine527-N7)-methyltransferase